MKVLNQMGPRIADMVRRGYPDAEVVAVPLDGPIDDSLSGDVLLSFRRAASMPVVATRVPWLHVAGAGVEGLDPSIYGDGRIVTCSRGAHAIPIAEFVMATIIAFERRVPSMWIGGPPAGGWMPLDELEARIEAGEMAPPADEVVAPPDRWGWMWMGEMVGKTVGLVGLGGIGAAVAQRALAFDMRVVAVRRTSTASPVPGVEMVSSLAQLLAESDHIVVCAPATPATERMLNDDSLALVKRGAHVINVARGSLIDEDALVRALDDGRIALASLDVSVGEPLGAGHRFYDHPRVRLSPHVSWTSPRRQERVIDVFIDNLHRRERGEELVGVVNPDEGY